MRSERISDYRFHKQTDLVEPKYLDFFVHVDTAENGSLEAHSLRSHSKLIQNFIHLILLFHSIHSNLRSLLPRSCSAATRAGCMPSSQPLRLRRRPCCHVCMLRAHPCVDAPQLNAEVRLCAVPRCAELDRMLDPHADLQVQLLAAS